MSNTKSSTGSLLKHVYSAIQRSDTYDEMESLKSLFDEESASNVSSTDTLNEKPSSCNYSRHWSDTWRWQSTLMLLNVATLCLSITFFFKSSCSLLPDGSLENKLLRQTSEHSPIFDSIKIPLLEVRRNGSFTEQSPPSIYRQDPSPEVDAAWERISNINTFPMSSDDVRKRGVDPQSTAKFPPSFGFGDDAHVARLDVFHQIHCLNAIRREINFDYYYGGKFIDNIPTPSHKSHVNHCMEIILEALTCSASVDPILHYWVDIQEMPFPNFNYKHICRDFSAILDWQEKSSVDLGYFKATIRRPDNVRIHHMSQAYKAALVQNQLASNQYEGES